MFYNGLQWTKCIYLLENTVSLGLKARNIACGRMHQYKERYISFFGCQNLGAYTGIPV